MFKQGVVHERDTETDCGILSGPQIRIMRRAGVQRAPQYNDPATSLPGGSRDHVCAVTRRAISQITGSTRKDRLSLIVNRVAIKVVEWSITIGKHIRGFFGVCLSKELG